MGVIETASDVMLIVGLQVWNQGCNARKVISEVYTSFVLSLGGNVNTRRIQLSHKKKSMKYSGHRKLLCELSKFNAFNLL